MKPTKKTSNPRQFWQQSAKLGAQLLMDGQEKSPNPLVWAAAMTMALEVMLEEGGPDFERDLELAKEGRRQLAALGVTFHIERGT